MLKLMTTCKGQDNTEPILQQIIFLIDPDSDHVLRSGLEIVLSVKLFQIRPKPPSTLKLCQIKENQRRPTEQCFVWLQRKLPSRLFLGVLKRWTKMKIGRLAKRKGKTVLFSYLSTMGGQLKLALYFITFKQKQV